METEPDDESKEIRQGRRDRVGTIVCGPEVAGDQNLGEQPTADRDKLRD